MYAGLCCIKALHKGMGPEPDSLGGHPHSVSPQLCGPRPAAHSLPVLGSSSQVPPCHLPHSQERDPDRAPGLPAWANPLQCCPVLLGGSLTFRRQPHWKFRFASRACIRGLKGIQDVGQGFFPVFQVGQEPKLLLQGDLRQEGASRGGPRDWLQTKALGQWEATPCCCFFQWSPGATSDHYLHFAPQRKMSLLVWRLAP